VITAVNHGYLIMSYELNVHAAQTANQVRLMLLFVQNNIIVYFIFSYDKRERYRI